LTTTCFQFVGFEKADENSTDILAYNKVSSDSRYLIEVCRYIYRKNGNIPITSANRRAIEP
jgi:hypothetical protein